MTDRLLMFVQFTVSVVAGCALFWFVRDDPSRYVKYGGPLLIGIAAAKVFTYVANGLRYGFKSIKSVEF